MWALNRMKFKNNHQPSPGNNTSNNKSDNQQNLTDTWLQEEKDSHSCPIYSRSWVQCFKKVCGKHRIQVYLKGGQTIKGLLVVPKDKALYHEKSQGDIQVQVWQS